MPVGFSNIKTTRGREYKENDIRQINEGLKVLPIEQRAAVIGSIIEESGGNPQAKSSDGKYQGLLQWGADRYVPKSFNREEEMNNQIQDILSTVNDNRGGVNWTHGGKGSGYNTKEDTYSTFNDDDAPFKDRYRAFSYGYVRPAGKEDSYNNRLKVAKDVLNRMVVEEKLSKPKQKKWTPMKFEQRQFPSKYSEGGDLNEDYWDNLSMADKAEMMRVAVANGMTTLPEIRSAYNEFAAGGYKPSGKLQKDIATWEGTEMQRNRPFSEMTQQFNSVVPQEIQNKLGQNQLDALYSYGYNVGMGNLKKRVLPTLTAYTQGKASREDVQRVMWASKDSQLRGLARRRNWERAMFGGDYRAPFSDNKIGVQEDASRYVIPQGFFENMGNQIDRIEIPQMQFQGGVDVDPETLYKRPVVDESIFGSNDNVGDTGMDVVYNPQEERREGMERLEMVMKMLGGKGLIGEL